MATTVISTPVVIKALKIGGSVFLFFGLIFVAIGGWKGYREYCMLKYWPNVDAIVTKCQTDHYRHYSGNSWNWANILRLEFRYTVAGRDYITSPSSVDYGSPSLMQQKADEYALGTHHLVRYNPGDPTEIHYDVGLNFQSVATLASNVIVIPGCKGCAPHLPCGRRTNMALSAKVTFQPERD